MDFIGCISSELSSDIVYDLYRYRYEVFVKRLGWSLNTPNGIEKDEFDHEETFYVIANDDEKNIVGCARLLPTTAPYLLERVFPDLLNGLSPPKSKYIWELSRFTSMDLNESIHESVGQISSIATGEILKEAISFAKNQGAKRLISVSPIGVERLLRRLRIKSHRAGPPLIIDGRTLIACWIDL